MRTADCLYYYTRTRPRAAQRRHSCWPPTSAARCPDGSCQMHACTSPVVDALSHPPLNGGGGGLPILSYAGSCQLLLASVGGRRYVQLRSRLVRQSDTLASGGRRPERTRVRAAGCLSLFLPHSLWSVGRLGCNCCCRCSLCNCCCCCSLWSRLASRALVSDLRKERLRLRRV